MCEPANNTGLPAVIYARLVQRLLNSPRRELAAYLAEFTGNTLEPDNNNSTHNKVQANTCFNANSNCAYILQAKGNNVAVLELQLHGSLQTSFRLLDNAFSLAPTLAIIDWRSAERNLDYPANLFLSQLERFCHPKNYPHFKYFMQSGGLEGVLQQYALHRAAKGMQQMQVVKRFAPVYFCTSTIIVSLA